MRAVVVDDEPLAREGLRLMLAAHPDVEVVGEAATGQAALALLATTEADLLLIDIQMPVMGGLELASVLPADRPLAVIFVTAHDQYAVGAFDVHALDYLLKPVDDRRLAVALDRARVFHQQRAIPRLAIRDRHRTVFVAIDDIGWIEAADYYVEIHVGPKTYLHREPLQDLERTLGDRFVRIHRSRLVNRDHVHEVRRDGVSGEMAVVLADGAVLRVARSCRARVQRSGP